jgi:hypothetical protein
VDPTTAVRDLDVTKALFDNYGHMHCGIYIQVTSSGRVGLGDAMTMPPLLRQGSEEQEPDEVLRSSGGA